MASSGLRGWATPQASPAHGLRSMWPLLVLTTSHHPVAFLLHCLGLAAILVAAPPCTSQAWPSWLPSLPHLSHLLSPPSPRPSPRTSCWWWSSRHPRQPWAPSSASPPGISTLHEALYSSLYYSTLFLTQFVFNLQTSVHYLHVSLLLCKNSLWQSSLVIFGLFCKAKEDPPLLLTKG